MKAGRIHSGKSVAKLSKLSDELADPRPSSRRAAAILIGRLHDPAAAPVLVDALALESEDRVRASLILAIGASGGATAADALRALTPKGPLEEEALAKARLRVAQRRPPC